VRLLAGILTGLAVAAVVASIMGVPVGLPRLRRERSSRPRLFHHFEAEGVPASRALAVSVGLGVAVYSVVFATTESAFLGLLFAGVVAVLPSSFYGSRGRKRDKEQRAAWPDALRGLVASLHAGRSLHEALVDLAVGGPVPLRRVFGRYHDLTNLAVPEAEALGVVRDELADPVADRVFEVLVIATDKGSRIALRVLSDLADAVTSDIQLVEKLDTADTEQRINTWAVFTIPWLTLLMLTARPGDFRDFYSGPDGSTVMVIGAAMSLGGMLLIRRLMRRPSEPRVLLSGDRKEER
jgi:tight adherence protein B